MMEPQRACTLEYEWYKFIAVPLISFFGGLLILLPCRALWYIFWSFRLEDNNKAFSQKRERRQTGAMQCASRVRAMAVNILAGQHYVSKAVVVLFFLADMTGLTIYLAEATQFSRTECGRVRQEPIQQVYLAMCAVYVIHLLIRMVSASDKLHCWIDVYSIVDHFTIGPSLYGLYVDRNWLGLRFLLLLKVLKLPDILQLLHIIKSHNRIRLVQIGTIFFGIWFCSAGFAHIIETSGDPFHNYDNSVDITYWACVYWLMVIMSTVGFGDISPTTDLGRVFIIVFIVSAICMFTSIIPELVETLGKTSKYNKPYKRMYGKRHIVVCGHVVYESGSQFMKNFLHEDIDNRDVNVVFLDYKKPSLELEAFFKRHYMDVMFVHGSVMDMNSLKDVNVKHASAVLILADRQCEDPDEEDAANIMRATSVKSYHPAARIIIQIHRYQNKNHLMNIPNWNWASVDGDDVICIDELKLGIMAQNCLAPGIGTLMSNLFTMRSYQPSQKGGWMDMYQFGAANEIYVHHFSPAFVGMPFPLAAELCFNRLQILLVGLADGDDSTKKAKLVLNPGKNYLIQESSLGYFIAQDQECVKCVSTFVYEENAQNGRPLGRNMKAKQNPGYISPLKEKAEVDFKQYFSNVGSRLAAHDGDIDPYSEGVSAGVALGEWNPPGLEEYSGEYDREMFDLTGILHWCPTQDIEHCVVDHQAIKDRDFHNHIVVCLLSSADAPSIGLRNFVRPLRASNIHIEELQDIIFMGDIDYLRNEWSTIANIPKLYVYEGNPLNQVDLRTPNLRRSAMVVVMSPHKHITVDETIVDKQSILVTLSIQSILSEDLEEQVSRLLGYDAKRSPTKSKPDVETMNLLTELHIDSNVTFLEHQETENAFVPLFLTIYYASGQAFASSVLDSLMSATFMDSQVLTFIRALISSEESIELTQLVAEDMGLKRKKSIHDVSIKRNRCRIAQLALNKGVLTTLDSLICYGDLFVQALNKHSILCLGLYRVLPNSNILQKREKRFVITSPEYDLPLQNDDMVFCLRPHHLDINENVTSSTSPPAYPPNAATTVDLPDTSHLSDTRM